MALLRKNEIPINFIKGIDTSSEDSIPVEIVDAVNLRYTKLGGLTKRGGYDFIEADLPHAPKSLVSWGGRETLALTDAGLYSYSPSIDTWANVANLAVRGVEETPYLAGTTTTEYGKCLCTENDKFRLIAWEETADSTLHVTVVDKSSNKPIPSHNNIVYAGATKPKAYNYNNTLYLFWVDSVLGNLNTVNILDNLISLSNTITIIEGDVHPDGLFDINSRPTKYLPIIYKNAAGTVTACFRDSILGGVPPEDARVPGDVIFADVSPVSLLKVGRDASDRRLLYIVYDSTASELSMRTISGRFSDDIASGVLVTLTGGETIKNVTFTESPGYTTIIFDSSLERVRTLDVQIDTATPVNPVKVIYRNVSLASEAFQLADNPTWEFLLVYSPTTSTFQSTYFGATVFLPDSYAEAQPNITLSSKMLPLVAYGVVYSNGLHKFSREGNVILPYKARTYRASSGDLLSILGLSSISLHDRAEDITQVEPQKQTTLLSGSIPHIYDGQAVFELGFNTYPTQLTLVSQDDPTVELPSTVGVGKYFYAAVYSFTDNQGNLYRSSPSEALEVDVVATGGKVVVLSVDSLHLTNKPQGVEIEIYRTENLGSVSYLVGSIPNDTTTEKSNYADRLPDASIISNELLYTTGRVIPNDGASPADVVALFQNRLWLANKGASKINYSKLISDSVGVETSLLFEVKIPHTGGDIVALKPLGDFLIVLREDSIGLIKGTGASATGQGANYDYDLLSEDNMGCQSGKSVISFNKGFLFHSSRGGIYAMGAGGNLEYIGLPVRDFEKNVTITSSSSRDNDEIWLSYKNNVTAERGILVYNTVFNTWTRYDIPLLDCTLNSGVIEALDRTTRKVIKFNNASDRDGDGRPILFRLRTGWLSFNNIRGYQRVYSVNLLGHIYNSTDISCIVYYDGRKDYHETLYRTVEVPSVYGGVSEDNYGQTTPYGGNQSAYTIELKPKKQRCNAIALDIQEIGDTPTRGLELALIRLVVGLKKGTYI